MSIGQVLHRAPFIYSRSSFWKRKGKKRKLLLLPLPRKLISHWQIKAFSPYSYTVSSFAAVSSLQPTRKGTSAAPRQRLERADKKIYSIEWSGDKRARLARAVGGVPWKTLMAKRRKKKHTRRPDFFLSSFALLRPTRTLRRRPSGSNPPTTTPPIALLLHFHSVCYTLPEEEEEKKNRQTHSGGYIIQQHHPTRPSPATGNFPVRQQRPPSHQPRTWKIECASAATTTTRVCLCFFFFFFFSFSQYIYVWLPPLEEDPSVGLGWRQLGCGTKVLKRGKALLHH